MANLTAEGAPVCTLAVSDIRKAFGINEVLKGVSISLREGEVLALIGGNGAGKSTLMKIIMGIYRADSGTIEVDGRPVNLVNPSAALSAGIYMVPQEPMLFPNMTVEENILMGFRDKVPELKKRLSTHMKELDFHLNLQRKANTLSIAEQQLVEILRGLLREAKVLILDEPTSALTFGEVQALFRVIGDLKDKGISMIYITHRLTEVFEVATDVAIMRDGVITLQGPVEKFNKEMLIRGLLPTDAEMHVSSDSAYVPVDYAHLDPVLEVQGLTGYGFRDISFKLYPGEILGIAGVVGAGRTELISKGIAGGRGHYRSFHKPDAEGGSEFCAGGQALSWPVQDPVHFLQYNCGTPEHRGDRQSEHPQEKAKGDLPEICGRFPHEDRIPG